MTLPRLFRLALRVATLPLYALYGLWALLGGAASARRRLRGTTRLLGDSLPCPACRTPNPIRGRFRCRACSGVYFGALTTCGICGSSASMISCVSCEASIVIDAQALP